MSGFAGHAKPVAAISPLVWRVGIKTRISYLKRSFGLRRTRLRRLAGARTWVGLGVFTTTYSA